MNIHSRLRRIPITVFIDYPTLIRFVDLLAHLPADKTAEFTAAIFEAGLDAHGAPPTLEQIACQLPLEPAVNSEDERDDNANRDENEAEEAEDCGDRDCYICFVRRKRRAL